MWSFKLRRLSGTAATPPFATNTTGTIRPSDTRSKCHILLACRCEERLRLQFQRDSELLDRGIRRPARADRSEPGDGSTIASPPRLSHGLRFQVQRHMTFTLARHLRRLPLRALLATSYVPGTLEQDKVYYWRVVARNGAASASSETVGFTVENKFSAVLPRLAASTGDLTSPDTSDYTGIAIANLGSTDATLELTAYSPQGSAIAGPGITNPVDMTLKPGQQIPFMGTVVFGAGLVDLGTVAWMKVESSSEMIASYFMEFNSSLTNLDGAVISNRPLTSFVFPQVRSEGTTQISIANPSQTPANLILTLLDADGNNLGSEMRQVSANGSLTETFAGIFPDTVPLRSQYVNVTSDTGVMPLEFLRSTSGDTECLSGLDTSKGGYHLYAPQYAVGGPWRSSVSLINLEPISGTVVLRFLGNDGQQIGVTRTEPIAPNGKIYIDALDYFGNFDGMQTGYLEIVSLNARLTGSLAFGSRDGNSFAASLPLVTELANSVVFSHIASNSDYYTGLAILNPNAQPSDVTINVYTAEGAWEFTTKESIPANGRLCKLLTEIFPLLARMSRTSGYIKVTSDSGIAAFALFGTQNLSSLAALPAQNMP